MAVTIQHIPQVPGVVVLCVDLADTAAMKSAISSVGVVHMLVNNAGVAVLQGFLDVTEDQYDRWG